MDLRSAHKATEKPLPRLRLSLTRSMSTDVDQGERAMYRRPSRRNLRQRAMAKRRSSNKPIRPLRKREKPMEEDWSGTSEEEKQESESTTEDRREDSVYGQSECSSPPLLERQDLEMEVEVDEKPDTDLTVVDTEMWTEKNGGGGGTAETRQDQTFTCDPIKDNDSACTATSVDAVTAGDGSDTHSGKEGVESDEEGVESGSELPRLERSNTTSVIVRVQRSSEASADRVTVCSTAEESSRDAKGDGQSVTTATTEHPGKVIVTDVTINCLTVTFKEAMMAEGFFKGY